ncbi:hypothetical protein AX17_002656 [Amanita inopinata Kibby_2008]|nr:hypothetical protein AX17_002656 [Amanita inopinata Kibby_2008]
MLELLKKFEEESMDDDITDLATNDDEEAGVNAPGADLAKRLQDIDLDTAQADALWSLLNEKERSKFLKALEDPNSELAQQLLASEELEKDLQNPWWQDIDLGGTSETTYLTSRPQPILVPSSMVRPSSSLPPLAYNVCAMCIAYAFTCRHLATSSLSKLLPGESDHDEAKRLVSQLVPFLIEKKSTTRFSSLSDVISDIWSRFGEGKVTSQAFATLLSDCARLLKPLKVSPAPSLANASEIDPTCHPHCMPALVLSDLGRLFSQSTMVESNVRGLNHITQKLLYYEAYILSTPSHILQLVSSRLETKSQDVEMEANWTGQSKDGDAHIPAKIRKTPLIETVASDAAVQM